jgi:hypothetical protein
MKLMRRRYDMIMVCYRPLESGECIRRLNRDSHYSRTGKARTGESPWKGSCFDSNLKCYALHYLGDIHEVVTLQALTNKSDRFGVLHEASFRNYTEPNMYTFIKAMLL